ncbi:hypothetical protein TNCV_690691 [Trichonephila clavipes]|nr:hypothetical protein TNCV_690691 [Trichonephila clavipes]
MLCRPSGIVVSHAACCAVGALCESQRRHRYLYKCTAPLRYGSTLNRATSSREVIGRGREMFCLKIATKTSQNALSPASCSRLRLTTDMQSSPLP